jgi:hypothetical protein
VASSAADTHDSLALLPSVPAILAIPVMERSPRPTAAVGSGIATEHEVAAAGGLRQVLRDRVVRAEHPAAALQRVFT